MSNKTWAVSAVIVILAHALILLGVHRILADLLFDQPPSEQSPVSVSVITPAPVLPPSIGPVAPLPAAPALIPPAPSLAQSDPAAADRPVSGDDPGSRDDGPRSGDWADLSGRQPLADELPRSGAIAISAFWGDFQSGSNIARGSIEIIFPQPDRYEIRLVTRAVGWARLFGSEPLQAKTEGAIGPGGFIPERYTHRSPRGREELTVFDYEKNKISYTSLKEPLPLLKGIQDRLSFMLQLAWMLKVSPERFGLGESIDLPMAGRNKIEEVTFTVMSDSEIVLPGGVLVSAVHLSTHRAGERFAGQIDIWLDRADRLLPVRIRFEEDRGQVVDLLAARQP